MSTDEQKIARDIRAKCLEMSHKKKVPHLGSSLSCVDIIVSLYWNILNVDPKNPWDPNRDRFILSKGHAITTQYAALAYRGFFPVKDLDTFTDPGGNLPEHPSPKCVPGLEVATGSLGHGLSLGLGMALAGRIQNHPYRVFVLMSDGECNEGSTWEAALLAAAQQVGTLTAIVDYNKWQATGRSNEVMHLTPMKKKWEAFGWEVDEIDGHDYKQLNTTLNTKLNPTEKPHIVIANTVKGKGVSFMEDDNNWHYAIPNKEQLESALKELNAL